MRKCILTTILFSLTLMLGSCQNGQGINRSCDSSNLDGSTICYDILTGLYAIEENATLVVGVDNEIYGQSIVHLWNLSYPEKAGSLQYKVFDEKSQNLTHEDQKNWPDVFLIQDFSAINREFTLHAVHSELAKIVQANTLSSYLMATNKDPRMLHYVPIMFEGVVFAYNKAMLNALGFDTVDTGTELPDSFDSWEKIFQISQQWDEQRPSYGNQPVNVIFPLDLFDLFSFYHVISSGEFSLFEDDDFFSPGYDQAAFLNTFYFLTEAREAKIAVDNQGLVLSSSWMNQEKYSRLPQKQMPFRLFSNHEIFTLLANDEFDDFVLAQFPTYKGIMQQSIGKTKGFVINSATLYRSAAMELLRMIYSKDGFALLAESTTYAPVLKSTSNFLFNTIEESLQFQFIELMSSTSSEPLLSIPSNPRIKAIEVSYYNALSDVIQKFWDQELTIDEVINYTIQWVNEKNSNINPLE